MLGPPAYGGYDNSGFGGHCCFCRTGHRLHVLVSLGLPFVRWAVWRPGNEGLGFALCTAAVQGVVCFRRGGSAVMCVVLLKQDE